MNFDIGMIQDPKCFDIGRLPARTYFDAYQFDEDGKTHSSKVYDLDGEWDFSYAENYESAIRGFEKTDYDCTSWNKIQVPGHIQLQGYDIPHYTNTAYPWEGKETVATGEVPSRFNPIALYVKYFECPNVPEGYGIRAYFGGIESGAAIWLNGEFIGYKEDSFDAGEYDITKYLVPGKNKLALMVFKWTVGSWFEDQDFFRFSGIYRSCWLYSVPTLHIEDIKVRTLLNDEYKDATLELEIKASGVNATVSEDAAKALITLTDAAGNIVLDESCTLGADNKLKYAVEAPLLWSAEKPNLYVLRVITMDSTGKEVELVEQNVGFRRFELIDGIMCINGKRIVFRGVNRHEFSCHSGRCVSYEETLADVLNMKANNINAIRTSHYPNGQDIYDLCDKYGLYMIAENNMETHGTWCLPGVAEDKERALPSNHMEYEPLLLDRVKSCYEIHKNHPSILIWSDGNESYGGDVILHMTQLFKKLDPDRIVHYEGVFNDRRRPETSDIESQMYTSVAGVQKFLAENPEKPFIMCEYTHAMGNSCGGMHHYTDMAEDEPRFQGGFIWDYVDQSLDATDRYGNSYQGYGGDFGDRPSDYNFSGNGIMVGDRTPSPKLQEVKYNYQPVRMEVCEDRVIVHNRNLFTSTSEYDAYVTVLKDGIEIEKAAFETAVAPLESGEYVLPVTQKKEPGEYVNIVSFTTKDASDYAPAGHEVAFEQFAYIVDATDTGKKEKTPAEVIISGQNVGVRGENFNVLISPGQGGIASYVYDGREYITTPVVPKPNFWRAPVDNDAGNVMTKRYAQWKIASMYLTHKRNAGFDLIVPEFTSSEDGLDLLFTYILPTTPQAQVQVKYEIHGDGAIDTTLIYDSVEELHDMPEFGMMFILDADLENVRWYGRGLQETYSDRKGGGKLGIWSNKVVDNMAKHLVPQECGNKEDVRWGEVYDNDGHGIRFTSLGAPMSFSALPYTPHEIENAMHPYELPPIHHTVVRVSLAQMGIGGDDSWGARVLPQYLINAEGKMEFKFSWKAF